MFTSTVGIAIVVVSAVLIATMMGIWKRRGGNGWALPIAITLFVEAWLSALLVYHKSIPTWEYVTFGASVAFAILLLFVTWPKSIEMIGGVILPLSIAVIINFTVHFYAMSWGVLDAIPMWQRITVIALVIIAIAASKILPKWLKIALWIAALAFVIIIVSILITTFKSANPAESTTETAGISSESTASSTATEPSLPPIQADMKKNGGGDEGEEYVLDEDVNPELDKSTTGNSAFNINGIRTPQAMVDWLSTKTTRGLAAITSTKDKTEAGEDLILDSENWHVLQALTDGHLTDNTGFVDGRTINVGLRDIKHGDLFLVFVNPVNQKLIYFRGACANPQGFTPQLEPKPTPTPNPTTTPTTTLQPKSSDPDDYKQPGDGTERDSGEGTKPIVPTVSETAESTPPEVITTTAPSETIIAPSATPVPTQAPTATPTPTPIPVVPTEPTSSGTIANPFG